jgi:uncharacterized membrane protein YwzB
MNGQVLAFAIVLLLTGIFSIATTSIGIQCSNECDAYKKKNESNQTFLIVNLVSAILVTLIACYGIYSAF